MKPLSCKQTLAMVGCLMLCLWPSGLALGEENELAKRVLKDWEDLTNTLQLCSGTATVSSKNTMSSRQVKDRNMLFAVRGTLLKRMESDDKEEVHYLWNSHGSFIVYKPKGESSWNLGKTGFPLRKDERITYSPQGFLMGGACISGVPVLSLLDSKEYEIVSCEAIDEGLIKIGMKYLPGMENFNFKDRLARDRTPVFDTAELYVDPEHSSRIMSFDLIFVAANQKRGRMKGVYSYSESLPLVPEKIATEGGSLEKEKPNYFDLLQVKLNLDAPPAEEFELEHYGITTPNMYVAQFPWYGYLFIVIAFVSLGLITRKVIANRRETHS